jgi:hypothetical protein
VRAALHAEAAASGRRRAWTLFEAHRRRAAGGALPLVKFDQIMKMPLEIIPKLL